MKLESGDRGIAFLCSQDGTILEMVRDDLGFGGSVEVGASFVRFLEPESRDKGRTFLQQVRNDGAAFRWEMNIVHQGNIYNLFFAAGLVNANIVVLGAESEDEASRFYTDLLAINNEQATMLRAAIKDRSELDNRATKTLFLYEELSRLNSEMVNVQRELHKKNQELEYTNNQKNLFLGMAAHDLRNPLGVIMSYSKYLSEALAGAVDSKFLDIIHDIHSSSSFMHDLVDNLLEVSRIESGKLELDLKRTDVAVLFKNAVNLNRPVAETRRIALHFTHEDGLPEVMIDPGKMVQVLNNLISNAIKYSPTRSVVQARLETSDGNLLFSVKDMGPGIPQEDMERIFLPYSRLDAATELDKSVGLGLAIVRKIVKGHRGRIWVESEEGNGSTFYVLFPIVLPEKLAPKASVGQYAPGNDADNLAFHEAIRSLRTQQPLRVLVAEDDPINSRMLRRFLELAGHEPDCVGNGKEALDALQAGAFDLVLMDHLMPVMNGLEAVKVIRENADGLYDADIPIIALTGQAQKGDKEKFLEGGMDGYLSKPIDRSELYAVIDRLAAGR